MSARFGTACEECGERLQVKQVGSVRELGVSAGGLNSFELRRKELRDRFVRSAGERADRLLTLVGCLDDSDREADFNELLTLLHRLAGSAGSFGYMELSESAEAAEQELRASHGDMALDAVRTAAERVVHCLRDVEARLR